MSEKSDGKWAPWWIYVGLIIGCNLGKQALIGGKVPDAANVAITVVMVAILIFGITAIYRAVTPSR